MLQKLKEIAKEFDAPVIILFQLTRAIEHRKDKRPRLNDVRDYKDLSAVDKVLFLYREHYYQEFNMPVYRITETDEEYRERFFEWNERLLSTEKTARSSLRKTRPVYAERSTCTLRK